MKPREVRQGCQVMVLDLGLAVLNFTNWGELRQRGSVGFLDQEAFDLPSPKLPSLCHPDSPLALLSPNTAGTN